MVDNVKYIIGFLLAIFVMLGVVCFETVVFGVGTYAMFFGAELLFGIKHVGLSYSLVCGVIITISYNILHYLHKNNLEKGVVI
jgi:hypothetical protein